MARRTLTATSLLESCADTSFDDGISLVTEFEPLGGVGSPVKPAIYEGGVFQHGTRWLPDAAGEVVRTPIIVIDNEASQANRLEAALLQFREVLGLPHFVLDLSDLTLPAHLPRRLSSLQFPHRNADAYLRDAELDGVLFSKTAVGKAVFDATPDRPEALFRWMPSALLFGFWQSHMGKKGPQTKLARSWSSHLLGIDPAATDDKVNGTKGDPLNLSITQAVEFDENHTLEWSVLDSEKTGKAKGEKKRDRLSEIGHGQVPFSKPTPAAVSFRAVRQQATVSFASLRRVSCQDPAANAAGRALLVAIGVAAQVAAFGRAVSLRSGCDLRPVSATWTLLSPNGDHELAVPTIEQAEQLLRDCIIAAAQAGLPVGVSHWVGSTALTPTPQLRKAIELSYPGLD